MTGIKMKALHLRKWTNADGSEGKWWTEVGTAWMNDRGIDLDLFYIPAAASDRGGLRIVLREDDGKRPGEPDQHAPVGARQDAARRVKDTYAASRDPELPARGQYAPQPQRPQGGGFQGQQRPQAPQGGAGQGGLRPQHRDGLQGGQTAQYGGAAAQGEPGGGWDLSGQGNDDGDSGLPF